LSRYKRNETRKIRQIALERIDILLTQADKIYSQEPVLAQRYGDLARKIAMKARIRMPEKWRMRFCHQCKKYLYPGITARTRIKSQKPSRVIYYCELCGKKARIKIIDKQS
jgi:ribonuclease P protein subunit RPR2